MTADLPHSAAPWGRLEVSAELIVDGRQLFAAVTVDPRAWQYETIRAAVIAELKHYLAEALIEEISPVIRIREL